MDQSSTKRSSLFLMELIVAILFFALASVVCVQVYVGSRIKSQDAAELTRAVLTCQNAAEQLYSSMDTADGSLESETSRSFLDKDWSPCQQADATYVLTLQLDAEGSFVQGTVQAARLDTGAAIYSLPVARQLP